MRALTIAALVCLSAPGLAFAATTREPAPVASPTAPPLYDPAPWWMRAPIIAATGEVQAHIPANRASFSAEFMAVDPVLAAATKQVTDKVRVLARTLEAYGADKAQVETSLSITPIYHQYRDKQGELQSNERADQIDQYQANMTFSVEVRDVSVLERAYAAVVSARPASVQRVDFSLEPSNETNTELFQAATEDAAKRAKLAVEAAGGHLGRVLLIDPTDRACETDVLVARAPRGLGPDAGGVSNVMADAERRQYLQKVPVAITAYTSAPPPAPAPGAEVLPADLLPLQPPLEQLARRVCVIYSLD